MRGNNAQHLANKGMHKDIQKLLADHGIGSKAERNHRGLLPCEINHKKINEEDVDSEPDYLIVVKKNRAAFLINQLVELNLTVKEFPSMPFH